MKKQTLQEQVSRIKGMMKPMNENWLGKPEPGESIFERFMDNYSDELREVVYKLNKIKYSDLEALPENVWDSLVDDIMSTYDENVLDTIQHWIAVKYINEHEIARFAISNMDTFGTEPQMVIYAIEDFLKGINRWEEEEEEEVENPLQEQVSRIKGMMSVIEQRGDEQSSNSITSPSGNKYYFADDMPKDYKPNNPRIYFNNGGSVSVQASHTHYCEPRNDEGPYSEMELGFPSQGTEIPQSLLNYEETSQGGKGEGFNPYETVYGYVPVDVIKELVDANGGIKSGELPPMVEVDQETEMNEQGFLDKVRSTIQSGVSKVADTLTSDASIKQFNDRILSIANTLKTIKKVIDPKTKKPVVIINNPQSRNNGMDIYVYFKNNKIMVGEVMAAKLVNRQGGKPLTGQQRIATTSTPTYRSYANPAVLPNLFNEEHSEMNEEQTPSNLVACSGLGVKSPGLCDKSSKRPVIECAKLGVKSIGYCFVDTKQPVTTTTTK
jgi:hypothetical protein